MIKMINVQSNKCSSLKCLAARTLNKNFYDIKKIPSELAIFIERH
jgi:hypothetical protein